MRNWFVQHWNLITIVILSLGIGWILLTVKLTSASDIEMGTAPQRGFLAPDFSLPSSTDELVSLSDFRGKPVLINLWASWCPPCRSEMPTMQRIYDEYQGEGFTILAINLTTQDNQANARAFAAENKITFPILFDVGGEVDKLYASSALPTSFFVGSDGIIQEVVIGGPMSEVLLRTRVEKLLEAP